MHKDCILCNQGICKYNGMATALTKKKKKKKKITSSDADALTSDALMQLDSAAAEKQEGSRRQRATSVTRPCGLHCQERSIKTVCTPPG